MYINLYLFLHCKDQALRLLINRFLVKIKSNRNRTSYSDESIIFLLEPIPDCHFVYELI